MLSVEQSLYKVLLVILLVQSASTKKVKRLWKAYVLATPGLVANAYHFNVRAEREKDSDPEKLYLWSGNYYSKGNAWGTKKGVMDAVRWATKKPSYASPHDVKEIHRPKLEDFTIVEVELRPTIVGTTNAKTFFSYWDKNANK